MRNWSIQRKTLAGFSAAFVVLLAVIAATYFTTESFLSSAARVPQSFEAIAAQERIYSDLVDMMWNQRSYVIGGNPADLSARTSARDRLVAQSALLPTLSFANSEEQRRRITILRGLIADELALLDEAFSARGAQNLPPQRLGEMRAAGLALLSRIRGTLDEIEMVERNRVAQLRTGSEQSALRLYGIIAVVTAVFLIAFGWLQSRIFADLETRDAVDRRLGQTNTFLESLLENMPTMIFVKDSRDLKFVRFNRAGEQLLGYPRTDLIGKSDRDFFPTEQADFFINKDREVLMHGKVTDIPEEEIDTRLQGRRILHTRKVPILDADGRPSLLLGISMDITEQKLAAREVLKLNDELRLKAELLTAANQDLESFCYSVSHDLRAPLRAIDGYAGIFEQDFGKDLHVDAKRLLTAIRNNSRHMAELIDDLLEFSRLGRQALEVSTIDMTQLATQAAAEVIGSTARPTISIQPLIQAQGDPRALYHVWLNLIDNAVKYSSHISAPIVTAWAERRDREIVYSVRDNGVGFDMQYYDKLFGVFERLHSSKDYPGTGVGLAIVQRVVARHGGRVWAESVPGQGATFHFALPANGAVVQNGATTLSQQSAKQNSNVTVG